MDSEFGVEDLDVTIPACATQGERRTHAVRLDYVAITTT